MRKVWFTLLLMISGPSLADEYTAARVEAIPLSATHVTEISQDLPIVDIYLSGTKEILWILGQKNLWRWNIDSQMLNRTNFKTILAKDESFRRLGSDGLSIFIASDDAIYQVQYAPFKVLRFAHPLANGQTINLFHNRDLFGWLHTTGHFFVDRYSKNLVQAFKGAQPLKAEDKVYFHQPTATLWYANLKNIYVMDLTNGKSSFLRATQQPVVGIGGTQKDVFVYSGREILKFSAEKKLVNQEIPVKGASDLAAASFDEDVHMYLFQNGTLETYHLASQHSMVSKVPLSEFGVNSKVLRNGNLAVVLAGGKFIAFRIIE